MRAETGLPVVSEMTSVELADRFADVVDVIQVGARNMQNYGLLEVVGKLGKPVLLKRGLSSTLDELLQAADYVLKEGNERVILCERGIRTFDTAMRFTLDLGAVPWLKLHTHLPVIVDPSHASGDRRLVGPLSRPRRPWAPTGSSSRWRRIRSSRSATGRSSCMRATSRGSRARLRRTRGWWAGGWPDALRVRSVLRYRSVCEQRSHTYSPARPTDTPPAPDAPLARPPVGLHGGLRRRYGDSFTLRIAHEGTWVFLTDPEAVKQVFTGDPRLLHAGEANIVLLPVLGSNSVLLLDERGAHGPAQADAALLPRRAARGYDETMAEVAEREIERWPLGAPLSAWPTHAGAHARGDHAHRLRRPGRGAQAPPRRRAVGGASRWGATRAAWRMLAALGPQAGRPLGMFRRVLDPADELIYEEIRRRRDAPATSSSATTCCRCCSRRGTRTAARCRTRSCGTS